MCVMGQGMYLGRCAMAMHRGQKRPPGSHSVTLPCSCEMGSLTKPGTRQTASG